MISLVFGGLILMWTFFGLSHGMFFLKSTE